MASGDTIYRLCPCGETAHRWTGKRFDVEGVELGLGERLGDTHDREFECRNCRRCIRSRERIFARPARRLFRYER